MTRQHSPIGRLLLTASLVLGIAFSPGQADAGKKGKQGAAAAARAERKAKRAAKRAERKAKRAAKKKARELFQVAEKHYRLAEFQPALDNYTAAYEQYPVAGLLFNMAQCHMELKNYERATFYFEQYAAEMPDAANIDVVEERLAVAREEAAKIAAAKAEEKRRQEELARKEEEERRKREEEERKRTEEQARLAAVEVVNATPAGAGDPMHPMVATEGDSEPTALYEEWWFWGAIGAVVVVATTTTIVLLANRTETVLPSGDLGSGVVDRRALLGAVR